MKIKVAFSLVLIFFLFSCGNSEKRSIPVNSEKESVSVIKQVKPGEKVKAYSLGEVFTADGIPLGSEQNLKNELNERALGKIRELSPKENDFICNCVIEDVRNSKDCDSILLVSLKRCNALLKKQRQEKPDFYFYSKDGDFIGTKPTVKKQIQQELKDAKVKAISDPLLDDALDCLGRRYRKMTTKEINNHEDMLLECLIDNS
ncbi:hypothetical protein EYY60_17620 [Flavobacterium zhairuonense]|uniref:hypothetical protein n=1 Tax=Flavobacterium zhairuonense TaxID=2493631 RepID=UPI00104B32F6|nr:hypothetical protein [Flavobacterium zhairuonense]KAF2507769.1 hypothetical protein EYY60_17620 [Flavobacterium zhairuonense]